MDDEIKEILDTKLYFDLDEEDYIKIKDYITNLQQDYDNEAEENLKLSEWLVEKQQRIEGLETENERLKEENVYCNRTDCVGRIKDSRKYDSVYQEKEDYKSRCEKAISKIKDLYSYSDNEEYVDNYCKDLLNILQNGSDDNE